MRLGPPRQRDGGTGGEPQPAVDRGARAALRADRAAGEGGDGAVEPGDVLKGDRATAGAGGEEQGKEDHGCWSIVSDCSPTKASVTIAARRPGRLRW